MPSNYLFSYSVMVLSSVLISLYLETRTVIRPKLEAV
jgi:hypothetical protein